MKDQVDALVEKGIRATFINSSISTSERRNRIRQVQNGEWELLYVAPGGLRQDSLSRCKRLIFACWRLMKRIVYLSGGMTFR